MRIPTRDAIERQRAKVAKLTERIGILMTQRADAEDRLAALIERLPECLRSMGCLCAGHARGNDPRFACDTSEVP